MAARTIVFDMDGTLVQTRAASWEVFRDTAQQFDLPVHTPDEFFELFRENFYASLSELCGDQALEAAVREHFLVGLRERYAPDFVPGMRDVVKTLAARYPLAVMSSNAMGAIRRILEDEGLAQCFAHVFSGEVGASKQTHLQKIIDEPSYGNARHCSPSYVERAAGAPRPALDGAEVVLVTDTVGDVREAVACGARAIGVAWGMHDTDELLAAGAEQVVLWPQELLAILLPEGPAAPAVDAACGCAVQGACATTPAVPGRPTRSTPPRASTVPARSPSWERAAAGGERRRQRRSTAGGGRDDARRGDDARRPAGTGAAPVASAPGPGRWSRPDSSLTAALHRIAPPGR